MVEIVTAVYREPIKNYLAIFFPFGGGPGLGYRLPILRSFETSYRTLVCFFFTFFHSGECFMKNEVWLEKLALII